MNHSRTCSTWSAQRDDALTEAKQPFTLRESMSARPTNFISAVTKALRSEAEVADRITRFHPYGPD